MKTRTVFLIFGIICFAFLYKRWYSLPETSKDMVTVKFYDGVQLTSNADKISTTVAYKSLQNEIKGEHKNAVIEAEIPVVTIYEKNWGLKTKIKQDTLWNEIPYSSWEFSDPSCGCVIN